MNQIERYEFADYIHPTEKNAAAIQSMTLQDVLDAGFDDPTSLANPSDPAKVSAQIDKLTLHSEMYSGYQTLDGTLVACMKSGEWLAGDEIPYVENVFSRTALLAMSKLRGGSLRPKAYGIFSLVTEHSLDNREREDMSKNLLTRSIGNAAARSASFVNIVIHDNDPLLPIAQSMHFQPLGPKNDAAGASGLKQQRFQRPVTDTRD